MSPLETGLPTLSWVRNDAAAFVSDVAGPFSILVDDYGAPNGPLTALTIATNPGYKVDQLVYVAACEPVAGQPPRPLHIYPTCPPDLEAALRGDAR